MLPHPKKSPQMEVVSDSIHSWTLVLLLVLLLPSRVSNLLYEILQELRHDPMIYSDTVSFATALTWNQTSSRNPFQFCQCFGSVLTVYGKTCFWVSFCSSYDTIFTISG